MSQDTAFIYRRGLVQADIAKDPFSVVLKN